MEKKKSTGLLLSILGVISLVLITAGVTYAFFSYTKEGEKVNQISTGSITFRYDENSTALVLTDALPTSDANGVTQTNGGDNSKNILDKKFPFTITSTTPTTATIPYVVTVRKDATSTIPETEAKIYLEVGDAANSTGTSDTGILTGNSTSGVKTYSELNTYATQSGDADYNTFKWYTAQNTDKVIYKGVVPASQTSNYVKYFDLGMWLKLAGENESMADYSAYEFVAIGEADDANGTEVATLRAAAFNQEVGGETYTGKKLLTSNEYYALTTAQKALYTRIAFVNYTAGTIIEKMEENQVGSASGNWEANEQYYPLNGKTFKVTVNVYAEGATVY